MSEDGREELRARRERETAAGLWPIGRALTVAGLGAGVGLATVTVVGLAVLGFPHLAQHKALSVGDLLDVLKLVLGTVAGVGALAALVMNYRKQRLAEVAEVREQQRMLHEQLRADDDRVREFAGGRVTFSNARFANGKVAFNFAGFTGSRVVFGDAKFTGGQITFSDAEFIGGEVVFSLVKFNGGEVDLHDVGSWGAPPLFDEAVLTAPPSGLRLPSTGTAPTG
ncbi:hypothetical protein [Actinoallomurus sp. NPDC050550]|uniref:hypothetical protein n=1 Tax=Actinoallomurus sp. NPDC050550 TaxID=3154937 RepID=UPI0033F9A64E